MGGTTSIVSSTYFVCPTNNRLIVQWLHFVHYDQVQTNNYLKNNRKFFSHKIPIRWTPSAPIYWVKFDDHSSKCKGQGSPYSKEKKEKKKKACMESWKSKWKVNIPQNVKTKWNPYLVLFRCLKWSHMHVWYMWHVVLQVSLFHHHKKTIIQWSSFKWQQSFSHSSSKCFKTCLFNFDDKGSMQGGSWIRIFGIIHNFIIFECN